MELEGVSQSRELEGVSESRELDGVSESVELEGVILWSWRVLVCGVGGC